MSFRRLPTLRARTAAALLAVAFGAAPADVPAAEPIPSAAAAPARQEARPLRRLTPRVAGSEAETARPSVPSAGGVLSALALVAVLFAGAAKVWKKHGPTLPGALPREAAEVLGRCRIEPRQSLYLVRLGSRILVVGSSGGSLSPVAEITDPVEVDLIAGRCRTAGEASAFSRLFAAKAARDDAVVSQEEESVPAAPVENPTPFAPRRVSPEQRLAERLRGRSAEEADRAA